MESTSPVLLLTPLSTTPQNVLPSPNHQGQWHAWKTTEHTYMVQPITKLKKPCGPIVFMSSDDMRALFHIEADPAATRHAPPASQIIYHKNINAADPNLLHIWYEEYLQLGNPSVSASFSTSRPLREAAAVPYVAPKQRMSSTTPQSAATLLPSESLEDKSVPLYADITTIQGEQPSSVEEATRQEFYGFIEMLHGPFHSDAFLGLNALIEREEGFGAEHKYMFSEFGFTLRKEKLFDLALLCHQKAHTLAPDDERILFNVARASYDHGNIVAARSYLRQALDILPDFDEAKEFLSFLCTSPQLSTT